NGAVALRYMADALADRAADPSGASSALSISSKVRPLGSYPNTQKPIRPSTLGEHEFSDGAGHYTHADSAYGPILAGKSGIWWFALRTRWDPGARYMPAEREVLNAARDRHQH